MLLEEQKNKIALAEIEAKQIFTNNFNLLSHPLSMMFIFSYPGS